MRRTIKVSTYVIMIVMLSLILTHQRMVYLTVSQVMSEQVGVATWYGKGRTRGGGVYSGGVLNCACNRFPRYSLLYVENLINGKNVVVWNSDRHEAQEILIDLSRRAFNKISVLGVGKIVVKVKFIRVDKNPGKEYGEVAE